MSGTAKKLQGAWRTFDDKGQTTYDDALSNNIRTDLFNWKSLIVKPITRDFDNLT